MGIVEAIWDNVSARSVSVWVLVILIVWKTIERIDEHRRIKRLGNYGPSHPSYLPFGLDVLVMTIRSTIAYKNLELWRDVYFKDEGIWTSEHRILNQRMIVTADHENIKAMLVTQFSDFGKGQTFHEEWKDFLGDGIFSTDGPQWQASRQLLRPQFTRDRVSDLHCFESHLDTFFMAMANGGPLNGENQPVDMAAGNGKVVNMRELFFRYTLDVTSDFLLGADVKSLSSPTQEFADAFDEVQRVQNIVTRTAKLRPFIPKASFWAGLKVINSFTYSFIDRALRLSPEELAIKTKSGKDYTFLHELASFTRDPKVLRDQIVGVLLAGRDTTASALSWAIYELSRHPKVVAKFRNEIIHTVGRVQPPTYDHLKNMPYLKAILNEILRLYPPVPFNMRLALKDTTLPFGGGKDGSEPLPVLKETPIIYSTLVMQRRADLHPPSSESLADPRLFSPERWANWHPKPHEYIPFNSGPRICIGQQFALAEMGYVLCRMFQRFDRVESHMHEIDGGDPLLKADILLSPGQGVHVAFWEAGKA